jgi:hypothetical protein
LRLLSGLGLIGASSIEAIWEAEALEDGLDALWIDRMLWPSSIPVRDLGQTHDEGGHLLDPVAVEGENVAQLAHSPS